MERAVAFSISLVVSIAIALGSRAVAADGYDSSYAGESAFLELPAGGSGLFTVFFANTGTATWVLGTGTQVDLAACLEDKVTCDAQDPQDAAFDDGWRSPARYAAQVQQAVQPGQIASFTYGVRVPAGAAPGTHHFNGALVVSATGQSVRDEGYYHDLTVVAGRLGPAPTLSTISPASGTAGGGTVVTIAGGGFTCSPLPTVLFGSTPGTVTTCNAVGLQATTPAHVDGAVAVTVRNAGSPASNALTYTYATDEHVPPTMVSAAATSSTDADLTFSEDIVCTISVGGARAFTFVPTGGSAVSATAAGCSGRVATASFPAGTFKLGVGGTLRYSVSRLANADTPIQDAAGNEASSGEIAMAALTGPRIVAASVDKNGLTLAADDGDKITLQFSAKMSDPGNTGRAQLRVKDADGTAAVIACTGAASAGDGIVDAKCALFGLSSSKTVTLTLLEDSTGELSSVGGNGVLDWPSTILDITGFADATDGFAPDLDVSPDLSIDAQ